MKPLVNGEPALDESWEELAEHSLTHDDLPLRDRFPYPATVLKETS